MKYTALILSLIGISICQQADAQIDTIVGDPEDHQIDATLLDELQSEILQNIYGEVHSLLIVRDGQLVFEKYYEGYDRDQLHPLYSVTKTFTSGLIGIGIDQGFIEDSDEYLVDFFPEYLDLINSDSLKREVRLNHMLTMTSGFGNETGIWDSNDYVDFMLNLTSQFTPGEVWSYSGGTTMLLSKMLQNRTSMTAEEFGAINLFAPIGINQWTWNTTPSGITGTAGGLSLRPLDMAAFGQLCLQKGKWDSAEVISEAWIDESVQVRIDTKVKERSYGYHLYQYLDSHPISQLLQTNDLYFASGANEQKLYVIPHLDCVVAITSNHAEPILILEKILLAMRDRESIILSVEDDEEISTLNRLSTSPNPFTVSTIISYSLSESVEVEISIHNESGHTVDTLYHGLQPSGSYQVEWDATDFPSGVYYCKFQVDNVSKSKRLIKQ